MEVRLASWNSTAFLHKYPLKRKCRMTIFHATLRETDIVALQEVHGGTEAFVAACPEVFALWHVWALAGPSAATGGVAILVRRARFPHLSGIDVQVLSPGRCLRVQFDCGDEKLSIWSLHNQALPPAELQAH
jgi:exonuclease III